MRQIRLLIFIIMLGVMTLGCASVYAQEIKGSVLFVAPHRLVVPPMEKVSVLTIANRSTDPRRYDLTIIDQVMDENGVTQRKDTFDYSVKRMVKFQPKRFSLKPGERQVVRVLITRPADLPDGDYHSHLLFREVPLDVKTKENLKEERKMEEKSVSFEIRTLYGIGVPIIVQQGKLVENLSLGEVKLGKTPDGTNWQLTAEFLRSGNSEAAGKMKAEYIQPGKSPVPVLEDQWIRVYREADKITRNFPLTNLPEGAQGGKIVVTFAKNDAGENAMTKEIAFN